MHPTRLSPLETSNHTRFQGVSWQGLFPAAAARVKPPDRQIIGGLVGEISWGWLHIDSLWVAEPYRHRGMGTALMNRAEAQASAMGVQQAYLSHSEKKQSYLESSKLDKGPENDV